MKSHKWRIEIWAEIGGCLLFILAAVLQAALSPTAIAALFLAAFVFLAASLALAFVRTWATEKLFDLPRDPVITEVMVLTLCLYFAWTQIRGIIPSWAGNALFLAFILLAAITAVVAVVYARRSHKFGGHGT